MKLPREAFNFYLSLGSTRTFQQVADNYRVSRQAVAKRAQAENWAEQVAKIDSEMRERSKQEVVESLQDMQARHIKTVQVIQKKALEGLKSMSLDDAMNCVRALDLALRQERVLRGEPSDRTAVSVEDVVRREYERWMGNGSVVADVKEDSDESLHS